MKLASVFVLASVCLGSAAYADEANPCALPAYAKAIGAEKPNFDGSCFYGSPQLLVGGGFIGLAEVYGSSESAKGFCQAIKKEYVSHIFSEWPANNGPAVYLQGDGTLFKVFLEKTSQGLGIVSLAICR